MKNVSGNAKISGNAWVCGNAEAYGYARVYGNAKISGNAQVYGNAQVSSNAWVSGNAQVSGNAKISGNACVYGNADIQSNNDWFSFIYEGQVLTGYRSRNELGYELNIDCNNIDISDLTDGLDIVVRNLISKFTPFADSEYRVMANHKDELMVVEPDGTVNRYKKVV